VPETPTGARTPGCSAVYSSDTASRIGKTVEDPSIATSSRRMLGGGVISKALDCFRFSVFRSVTTVYRIPNSRNLIASFEFENPR